MVVNLRRDTLFVCSSITLGLVAFGCSGGGSSGGSPAAVTNTGAPDTQQSPSQTTQTTPTASGSQTPAAPAAPAAPTGPQPLPPGVSLAAFETTLHPVLTANCATCHSSGSPSTQ